MVLPFPLVDCPSDSPAPNSTVCVPPAQVLENMFNQDFYNCKQHIVTRLGLHSVISQTHSLIHTAQPEFQGQIHVSLWYYDSNIYTVFWH